MKTLKPAVVLTPLVLALTTGASMAEEGSPVESQLQPPDRLIQMLDPIELETTRGGIAPLAIALGIASFDLALSGFYWGVYLPYYAPQEPSFSPASIH